MVYMFNSTSTAEVVRLKAMNYLVIPKTYILHASLFAVIQTIALSRQLPSTSPRI